jgi:hypothetical protein
VKTHRHSTGERSNRHGTGAESGRSADPAKWKGVSVTEVSAVVPGSTVTVSATALRATTRSTGWVERGDEKRVVPPGVDPGGRAHREPPHAVGQEPLGGERGAGGARVGSGFDRIVADGITFDDVLLIPQRSDILPSEADCRPA